MRTVCVRVWECLEYRRKRVNVRVGMSIVLENSVNVNSVCPCVGVFRVPEERVNVGG